MSETKWVKQFIELISAVENCLSSLADFTMCDERKKDREGGEKKEREESSNIIKNHKHNWLMHNSSLPPSQVGKRNITTLAEY